MVENKPILREVFRFNHDENGGEALILTTEYFVNDTIIEMRQELSLQSYGRSASINLGINELTPYLLRVLADHLENGKRKANKMRKNRTSNG